MLPSIGMREEPHENGTFDGYVAKTESFAILASRIHQLELQIERIDRNITTVVRMIKKLPVESGNLETNKTENKVTNKEDEVDTLDELNKFKSELDEELVTYASTGKELTSTQEEPTNKDSVNALILKTLNTKVEFGRKYNGMTFEQLIGTEEGFQFIERLAKSQSRYSEDAAHIVRWADEEPEQFLAYAEEEE